jgi:hypothetical protein
MTKLSHGCGWCFLPAIWAGEAALKFIVDIIIWNYLLYSDWLTELPNIFGLPGSGETSPDGWLGAWTSHSNYHKGPLNSTSRFPYQYGPGSPSAPTGADRAADAPRARTVRIL